MRVCVSEIPNTHGIPMRIATQALLYTIYNLHGLFPFSTQFLRPEIDWNFDQCNMLNVFWEMQLWLKNQKWQSTNRTENSENSEFRIFSLSAKISQCSGTSQILYQKRAFISSVVLPSFPRLILFWKQWLSKTKNRKKVDLRLPYPCSTKNAHLPPLYDIFLLSCKSFPWHVNLIWNLHV